MYARSIAGQRKGVEILRPCSVGGQGLVGLNVCSGKTRVISVLESCSVLESYLGCTCARVILGSHLWSSCTRVVCVLELYSGYMCARVALALYLRHMCTKTVPFGTFIFTQLLQQSFVGHEKGVYLLEHSPDFRMLATAGFEYEPLVWVDSQPELPPFRLRDDVQPHKEYIVGLHIVPGTPQVISCDRHGLVKVWDIRRMRAVRCGGCVYVLLVELKPHQIRMKCKTTRHTPCTGLAHALYMPCACPTHAVHTRLTCPAHALRIPCTGPVRAPYMPGTCPAYALYM